MIPITWQHGSAFTKHCYSCVFHKLTRSRHLYMNYQKPWGDSVQCSMCLSTSVHCGHPPMYTVQFVIIHQCTPWLSTSVHHGYPPVYTMIIHQCTPWPSTSVHHGHPLVYTMVIHQCTPWSSISDSVHCSHDRPPVSMVNHQFAASLALTLTKCWISDLSHYPSCLIL